MKSGLVILSNAIKYGYPYIESIKSVLPCVDEMVVVVDINSDDGTWESLENLPVRRIHGYFDLDVVGWKSYGIMRTLGYQACKGDIVVMFDADGVVHEKDQAGFRDELEMFSKSDRLHAFWMKYRLYKPTLYRHQKKHSGIYKKSVIGDKFDFFHPDGRGIPNMTMMDFKKGLQLSTHIFGYEHFWYTREIFTNKIIRYGKMLDKQKGAPIKTDLEYFDIYLDELNKQLGEQGMKMKIEQHPASMQERLNNLTIEEFAFNWFGYCKV